MHAGPMKAGAGKAVQQDSRSGGAPARYLRSSELRRPPPPARAEPEYPEGCLVQRLAVSRLADLPFLLPAPDKCTTEHALAVQVQDVVLLFHAVLGRLLVVIVPCEGHESASLIAMLCRQ